MGVVVGLSWGLCTTLLFSFKALLNQSFNHPHEVAPFSLCLYKYKKNEHTSVNNSIKSRANVTKF